MKESSIVYGLVYLMFKHRAGYPAPGLSEDKRQLEAHAAKHGLDWPTIVEKARTCMKVHSKKSRFAERPINLVQVYFNISWIILSILTIISCFLIGLCFRGEDTVQQIKQEQMRITAVQVVLKEVK